MYLEISGRRTGKTARMVKEVHNCVLHYNSIAVIFAFNMHYGRVLREEHFNHRYFDENVKIFSTQDQYWQWFRGRRLDKSVRLFYDEFEAKDDVILDIQGYYASTPYKSLYNKYDTLPHLISINGGTFIRNIRPELEKEFKNYMPKEVIDKEVFAKFSISKQCRGGGIRYTR